MLTKTNTSGTTQYGWDIENRLTQAVVPGVGMTTFRYDPFGRRIQKSGPSGTVNYVYDGANAIGEVNASGNLLTHYSQGAEIDEPLGELRSGASALYEQDGLGSVTSLSNSTAALANSYVYDTFGNIAASGGSFVNPYLYTGRDYDSETGLQYYRARYYDPQIGRFIGEDPIRFRAGVNFFKYVKNSPPTFKDAYGLREECGLVAEHRLTPWIPSANIVSVTPWMFKDFAVIDDQGLASVRCRWERTVKKALWGNALFVLEYRCVSTNPCDQLIRQQTHYRYITRQQFQGYRTDPDWTGNSYSMFQ
jgi:RHS repeat-associated protein